MGQLVLLLMYYSKLKEIVKQISMLIMFLTPFPNGIPNPLLEENRNATAEAVLEKADFGVAFDGD